MPNSEAPHRQLASPFWVGFWAVTAFLTSWVQPLVSLAWHKETFNLMLGEATIQIWNVQRNNSYVFQITTSKRQNKHKEKFSEACEEIFFLFPGFSYYCALWTPLAVEPWEKDGKILVIIEIWKLPAHKSLFWKMLPTFLFSLKKKGSREGGIFKEAWRSSNKYRET